MDKFINYYDILGVPSTATETEIKKAYQKLAKTCHPDMTKDLPEEERKERETKFILGTEGYDILKNKKKKSAYDEEYYAYQEIKKQRAKQKRHQQNAYQKQQASNSQTKKRQNTQHRNTHHNRDAEDDYITREIIKDFIRAYQDEKAKEYSVTERIRAYNEVFKEYPKATMLKKGFIIFGSEILYSGEKLKLRRKNDASHYIMRNRGKALLAFATSIALISGIFSNRNENPPVINCTEQEVAEYLTPKISDVTVMRTYTVEIGDTLSGLAEEANCTREEIRNRNKMETDILYYREKIKIPYHIPQEEIDRYTTVEIYQAASLQDFAEMYETDAESLQKINPDAIIEINGRYTITTDTIKTPTFAPYEYRAGRTK